MEAIDNAEPLDKVCDNMLMHFKDGYYRISSVPTHAGP